MPTLTYGHQRIHHPEARPGLVVRMRDYLKRSRAEHQMQMLDDRMLADIGIRRAEISSRVWG